MVKLILLVPAIVLLALGSEGLFQAIRGRHDAVVTCEEYARTRPPSIRVRITGCELDYAHAAYRESGSTIEELFLPVRASGQGTAAAPIVVATSDPAAMAIAQRVLGGNEPNDQSLAAMKRVADYLGLAVAVDGVVRAGWIERLRSRRILSRLADSVASDAVVIDLRATPTMWRPALALAAGLAILGLVWLLMRRSTIERVKSSDATATPASVLPVAASPSSIAPAAIDAVAIAEGQAPAAADDLSIPVATTSDQPTPPETAPPEPVVQAEPSAAADEPRVTVMLPKLLLLNVDVLAGPEAVETAPPLGTRTDVGAILSGVIPDLEFIDGTRVLGRSDGSIRLDIGAHDTVVTIVVEVHGQAGIALIKELLLMTGWRAFAPKTGLFVTADDLESLAALAGNWKLEAGS